MSHVYQSHKLNGDSNLLSTNGNPTNLSESCIERSLNDQIRILSEVGDTQENICSARKTCKNCDHNSVRSYQGSKASIGLDQTKKILGEENSVNNLIGGTFSEDDNISSVSSVTISQFDGIDPKTFRPEDYSSDCLIDTLTEKYVCVNFEFDQLQRHRGEYVKNTTSQRNDKGEIDYSDSSDNPLERKRTQVFRHCENTENELPNIKKASKRFKNPQKEDLRSENKENLSRSHDKNKELKLILKTLKKMFRTPIAASRESEELRKLYKVVKTLQEEQEKFRNIIKEQQDQINLLYSKHLHAQNTIQYQKYRIKHLSSTNNQLENEITSNVNMLREKINEVSHLPRAVKSEKIKADQLSRENSALITKLQQMKQELVQAKTKLEVAGQKRVMTLNKLKNAERDLKIFRNQNNIFKTEKRILHEEINKLKCLNDKLKASSSKIISRQKERGDSEQHLLRKKISDLESDLNQSRNSTSILLEERDKLIAELQIQLNTLVHNFEVSQKHIRILRKHIYTSTGNQIKPEKNV